MRGKIKAKLRRFELTSLPNHALEDVIHIPEAMRSHPFFLILRRFLIATGIVFAIAGVVYITQDGYNEELNFIDALYYSTISLTTTGYGDIVPVTTGARLANIILVTPARLAFLILLVGTTLSVLTERSRKTFQIQQWRKHVHDHTIIIGFGTKGQSAMQTLLDDGTDVRNIVVVDPDRACLRVAEVQDIVTVQGSGTKSDVLKIAGIERAKNVVVATNSDDTNVLATLSAREMNKKAKISAAVREIENRHLLLQSGANSTVVSSETAGRLLGLSTSTPSVVRMMDDLLSPSAGFFIAERPVAGYEVGANPRHLSDIVLSVIRNDRIYRVDTDETLELRAQDRLLYIRKSDESERKKNYDKQPPNASATKAKLERDYKSRESRNKNKDSVDHTWDCHGRHVDEQRDLDDSAN